MMASITLSDWMARKLRYVHGYFGGAWEDSIERRTKTDKNFPLYWYVTQKYKRMPRKHFELSFIDLFAMNYATRKQFPSKEPAPPFKSEDHYMHDDIQRAFELFLDLHSKTVWDKLIQRPYKMESFMDTTDYNARL